MVTIHAPIKAALPPPAPMQRARGEARLSVRLEEGRVRLEELYQDGCAKIGLPRAHGTDALEAVLINTGGGVTGGDCIDWRMRAGPGAGLTVTTQACEKVYRASDVAARVSTHLTVGEGADLEWLPQETILFDRSALDRSLEADIAPGGRLLALEAVILGRTAMGEQVLAGRFSDRWRIRRAGRLVFADDLRLTDPAGPAANRAPLLAGAGAFASLLLVDDDCEALVQPLRAVLGEIGGASAFSGRLFCRIAAPDGARLRTALIRALAVLRPGRALPKVWST